MSSAFSDREKAFEDKWAHDEELRFKVLARRNKLLGLWAAGEMGLKGPAADDYAKAIVQAELTKDGDEAVFQKLRTDFAAANTASALGGCSNRAMFCATLPGNSSTSCGR